MQRHKAKYSVGSEISDAVSLAPVPGKSNSYIACAAIARGKILSLRAAQEIEFYLPPVRRETMLDQIDFLPGAKYEPAIAHGQ
jgi:hypothetical protein